MSESLSENKDLQETIKIEEPVKFEDLSDNCKKAIKKFKSWLKKHVGDNYSNVIAIINSQTIFAESKLFNFDFDYKIKTSMGFQYVDHVFSNFAMNFDLSNEETDKALKLMKSKNFYYMPKIIKIKLAGNKTKKEKASNA